MDTYNTYYIGIDVSKSWFDASLMAVIDHIKQPMDTQQFDNTKQGLKQFVLWLKKARIPFNNQIIVVIENTGIYHRLLWQCCCSHNIPIHIGNAAHIKWSFGIARGKNDQIDSQRLCNYAFKESDTLKTMPGLDADIIELKDLITSRKKLLKQRSGIIQHLKELKTSNPKSTQALIEKAHQMAISGINQSINAIQARIKEIIRSNKQIKHTYKLLLSVPGIGHQTAIYLIACTLNFTIPFSGKQLASYAGVAPFEHRSGSSIKGKNRVHKMANKKLKALLHMGAMSCIRNYPEFRIYYERKIGEGKHGFAVLNAIKNKLLLRVAAVIKNQKPYESRHPFEQQNSSKNYLH